MIEYLIYIGVNEETIELLKKYNPDILVLTGHDAYYRKKRKSWLFYIRLSG